MNVIYLILVTLYAAYVMHCDFSMQIICWIQPARNPEKATHYYVILHG